MPWNETCAMTERMKFVALVEEGDETIAALLPAVRDQSEDWIQVVGALRCRRDGRPVRSLARGASSSECGERDHRESNRSTAERASELGPAQAACAIAHD